jgi:hypothetical protein
MILERRLVGLAPPAIRAVDQPDLPRARADLAGGHGHFVARIDGERADRLVGAGRTSSDLQLEHPGPFRSRCTATPARRSEHQARPGAVGDLRLDGATNLAG